MKKRFFAALLSFIMVFSLLPLNALAVNRSVPLTLNVSSYSAPFINGNTGEHTVGWYKALKYISRSAVGSDNASGSATARFEGSNETGWTLVIDVVVGNYKETWTTNARITNKDMSAATGSVTFGLSFNTSGGTSTNIIISGAKDLPAKPSKPSGDDIKNLLGANVVKVACTNTSVVHADKTYSLLDGSFTVGDVQGSAGSYTCTVTVNAAKYVAEYNKTISGHSLSTTDTTPKSITLAYDGTKWVAQTATPIVFNVVCDETPDDPKVGDNFDFDKNIVDVICETTSDHNYSYGLMNDYYTVSDRKQLQNGNWQCEITINLDKYFALYNSEHPGHTRDKEHKEATSIMRIYPTWYARSGKWIFVGTGAAKIYVKCDAVTPPTEPSEEDVKKLLGDNAVQIICTNDESGHGSKTFGLIDGTFSVRYDGQYTCEVKIDSFNKYVEEFNTELDVAQGTHIFDASKTSKEQSIINLKWVDGKWTVMDAPAKHHVLCVTPKYTVTYTDGVDGEEVFADQVYGNLLSGTATPAFNGTPTRTDYFFAGWKPEVAPTVTGNATYVAQWKDDKNNNGIPDENEDKYTVTYTDGVNNEEVFADQVYDNLLSGTTTPAFNGTPTRDGYVFAGWEPEVAEKVTENATYAAQWKEDKNNNGIPDENEDKYTVTYTDGVDGEEVFANQVYENLLSGTDTPAFNGTPTREGYVFAGWKPAVAKKVTANATYTAQWTARTDLSYTVHYYLKDTTKQVADDKTVDGQTFNATVTENAIRISGYRVYGDSEKSITIGTGTNEIIFYYTRASRPSTSSASKPTLNTGDHYAYVMGYPDGTVKPTGDVTRAEVAAILYRVMDADCVKTYETTRCSFSDVVRGDWFNTYVATLENAGVIVDTRTNGKFRPNEAITRAELAAMLAQFADIKSAANSFNDVSARHWASDEIAVCAKMGWINGYPDGSFRPDATITRAEMMAMINHALDRTPKSVSDLLSGMKTWSDNANTGAWYYLDVQEATNSHTYMKSGTHETWKKLH